MHTPRFDRSAARSLYREYGRRAHLERHEAGARSLECQGEGLFGRTTGGTHFSVFKDGPATPATLAPTGGTSPRYPVKPAGGAGSAEKTFDDAGPKNSCPTLIEVGARDFRALWDSGTKDRSRTDIRFGQFLVSDQPCAHFTDE